jgi:hypothetical protein
MKLIRIAFAMVVALGFGRALAFHSGGVAECSGCHTMHSAPAAGYALLIGTDASSTCLQSACHHNTTDTGPSSYHISSLPTSSALAGGAAPSEMTPGGDFGWLKKDYTWAGGSEPGEEHGHNIVAVDVGYTAVPGTAPGGTYSNASLSCISCHDPHGQARRSGPDNAPVFSSTATPVLGSAPGPIVASGSYTNSQPAGTGEALGIYRILAAPGYTRATGVTWGAFPIAIAPATYNRSEATGGDTRVSYGGTAVNSWGDWCGSCHGDFHLNGGGANGLKHPTERALSGNAAYYNAYVKTGDLTGSASSAYTSLVPFAQNTTDFAVLKASSVPNSVLANTGPDAADRVTCLSCHRAHASGMPWALRWQMEYEFMTKVGVAGAPLAGVAGYTALDVTGTGGRGPVQARGRLTQAEYINAYYGRPASKFATYQRLLCNKCHIKD